MVDRLCGTQERAYEQTLVARKLGREVEVVIFWSSLQFVRGQNSEKSFSTQTLVTQASDSKDIAKIGSSDSRILAPSGSYLILCTDRLS